VEARNGQSGDYQDGGEPTPEPRRPEHNEDDIHASSNHESAAALILL
jgi:hypothetical protein